MDGERFDQVTKALTTTVRRRQALAGFLGGAIALGRRPEVRATHVDCKHVGARCRNADRCCSGICRRKKCRAHDVGTCKRGQDYCADTEVDPSCNGSDCVCYTTTGGARFCGNSSEEYCPTGFEAGCVRDVDCGTPGAACVNSGLLCSGPNNPELGSCNSGTEFYCVNPCPTAP
jgi:hypothetical protein